MCKIWISWDIKVLPLDYVTINQTFSPIPQFYAANSTILAKNKFWKISHFSTTTYILCKIWICWKFKVLPPDYMTINQNFSLIPRIYIPNTTILAKNNFSKISQFSRKTYIACKIWKKRVLKRFLKCYPLIM